MQRGAGAAMTTGNGVRMPKNIVICCDGTLNEIGETISNLSKLYRIKTMAANSGAGAKALREAT
jgi:uncharacterized protein (DUF2235 family)